MSNENFKDGSAGDRGTIYEKRLCMLFAVRAYIRDLKDFQLRYQVPEEEVGKFDDIVFYGDQKSFQVFQLKHKETEEIKISNFQLFNESFNADYNLLKYIKSLMDLISNNGLRGKIKMAVVLTNIDFDLQSDNKMNIKKDPKGWCDSKTEIQLQPFTLNNDFIFKTSNSFAGAKYYKLNTDKIIEVLIKQKETMIINLTQKLKKEVKPTGNQKFDEQQQNLKKNNGAFKKFLEDITKKKIRKALNLITYAVGQPNDKEIEQIIKNEIMEYFQLQNVDTVYNAFETAFTKWCSTKAPLNEPSSSSKQQIIGFKDIKIFFEKNVKKIFLGFTAPTESFTGRLDELNCIREKLKGQHDFIISQVAITGLGGIGKTELTKQFIKEYGQSDFYGRVIWIEAESDESVKNSFTRLAEKIKIDDREKKSLLTIIDDVFEYINGFKVLFVFDNFDKNTEENEVNPVNNVNKDFVIYCQKQASTLPKENRPYFIFTSRNRKCLQGVESLDLKVLKKEDAQELIMRCLKNSTKEDAENLAEKLQNFPLALKQTIAYIIEQNEIKNVLGSQYQIKDYLTEFDNKREELLNYAYTNDFGENEKTTFVTWNVTLDAILKDKTIGESAIEVLKIMSYLYADKIDANMFLPLFDNNETRCGKAFLLLNKYSLITKIEKSTFKKSSKQIQIHRLVQAVVQLKFKVFEKEILVQVWKSVNFELFKEHLTDRKKKIYSYITDDEYHHYNNLLTYMKNNETLNNIFSNFFEKIQKNKINSTFEQGDIEKIKELKLSKDVLKDCAVKRLHRPDQNKKIIYFLENGYFDFDQNWPLLCLREHNFHLFKYFVGKDADLSELTILSTEFICDIKEGKLDSIFELIESEETETNVRKLKESLFFAALYNQDSIVEFLIDKNVQPDFKNEKWNINYAPIVVAKELKYLHIVKILLKSSDKLEFWNDLLQMIFEFLKIVADINDVEYGGRNYTHLYNATNFDVKVKIANFLINGYSDYSDVAHVSINVRALLGVLKIILDDPVKKSLYENILIKMRSNAQQCEFLTLLVKTKIDDQFYDTHEILKNLNNYKDDTKLISCVRDLTMNFLYNHVQVGTVKTIVNEDRFLVEYFSTGAAFIVVDAVEGVDVDATDQNDNNALYYAIDLDSSDIFEYLLPKTNSVDEKILMKVIKKDKLSCIKSLLETRISYNHIFSNEKSLLEVPNENKSFKIINHLQISSKVYENDKIMGLINYMKNCIKSKCQLDHELVKFLVDIGVNVNTMDSDQHNALYYSIEFKHLNDYVFIFMYLLSKGSLINEDTLERAIELNHYLAVETIIPKYFNKNHYLKNHGCSIFDFAIRCHAKWTQQFLLRLNAEKPSKN